jgi:hypothetical protein
LSFFLESQWRSARTRRTTSKKRIWTPRLAPCLLLLPLLAPRVPCFYYDFFQEARTGAKGRAEPASSF